MDDTVVVAHKEDFEVCDGVIEAVSMERKLVSFVPVKGGNLKIVIHEDREAIDPIIELLLPRFIADRVAAALASRSVA